MRSQTVALSHAVDISGHQLIGEGDFVQVATGRSCKQSELQQRYRFMFVCGISKTLTESFRLGGGDSHLVRITVPYPDR